jgi:hypothetical protein
MPEEITAGRLATAAINSNPELRIELDLIRPPAAEGAKAYFYAGTDPDTWDPAGTVVLSVPDRLWAMLGRRGRVVARLSIEDDE